MSILKKKSRRVRSIIDHFKIIDDINTRIKNDSEIKQMISLKTSDNQANTRSQIAGLMSKQQYVRLNSYMDMVGICNTNTDNSCD